MKLIDFIDLLDTFSKGFADYEVVISKEGGTYCVVNIEIDSSKHVINLVDSSELSIDDTIHDATERATAYCESNQRGGQADAGDTAPDGADGRGRRHGREIELGL